MHMGEKRDVHAELERGGEGANGDACVGTPWARCIMADERRCLVVGGVHLWHCEATARVLRDHCC